MGRASRRRGDAAEFLDVDVDEFTWPFAFVADRCRLRGADAFAGQRVAFAQARHIVAAQDAADGPRGNAQQRRQSIGAQAQLPASVEHPPFGLRRCAPRTAPGTTGAVLQASVALGVEAAHPAMRALARHTHHRRHMGDGHPPNADPLATSNRRPSMVRRALR